MPSLDDAIHRLNRGKEQLAQFYESVSQSFEQNNIVFKVYSKPFEKPTWIPDERPWHFYTAVIDKVPAAQKRDGILLDECIQSFKIALDYVAWGFAIKYSRGKRLGVKQKRSVGFPMCKKQSDFISGSHMIPNVVGIQRAFFERYQPYRRRGRPLRALNILANADKHRLIVPLALIANEGDIQFKYQAPAEVIYSRFLLNYRRHLKDKAPILTVCVADAPPNEGKVKVDFKGTVLPVFPTSIIKGRPPRPYILVEEAMNDIRDVCTEIITQAANVF